MILKEVLGYLLPTYFPIEGSRRPRWLVDADSSMTVPLYVLDTVIFS
jgi:hypothetical protein